jgi:S-DNA-T family DNA segregation ATPase FtsK/SpoIIIE
VTKRKTARRSSGKGSRTRRTTRTPRSARGGAGRQSASKRRSAASRSAGISPQRKNDILGLLLIGAGILTVLSIFSARPGVVGETWLKVLSQIFGWGTYVLAPILLAAGVYLILQRLGERAPHIDVEQVLGGILLYLALLILLHAVLGPRTLDAGMVEARLGRGGGAVGAVLLSLLLGALGAGGTAVVMAAWILVGITITAGLSFPDVLRYLWRGVRWVWGRLGQAIASRQHATPEAPTQIEREISDRRPVTPTRRKAGLEFGREGALPEALPGAARQLPSDWDLPELTQILEKGSGGKADAEFDRQRARVIEETLEAFGAPAKVVEIDRGPTITRFGVQPAFMEGRGGRRIKVKVSKISSLADDLALAMAARSVRIQAPVPGKGYVGVEVPNAEVSLVALRDVMESEAFQRIASPLRLGLGKDVSGRPVAADLAAMPHLLIAGTTGSGKSVCVNSILACLLLQNTPDHVKLVLVDPKRVELTFYNGIPHLLAPVVVDLTRVVPALQWVSREMDERYHRFSREGVRNIGEYNKRMQAIHGEVLPFLLVVIDELADLMMMAADETERVLTRLAQLARATGIHLVIATQRPSVDVVTGLIKANFPARIAFAVASSVDSRVILDQPGAEKLLGRGDMLFHSPDAAQPVRLQGSYVSEGELARLLRYWRNAALGGEETQPVATHGEAPPPMESELSQAPLWESMPESDEALDEFFDQAVEIVRQMRRGSISLLQRRLRIGYTRAARLVDQLEAEGILGPAKGGSQAREVLDYGDALAEHDG